MDARWLLAIGLIFPVMGSPASAQDPLPLQVHQGRCEVILTTEHPDDQFYLILGTLGRGGPYRVEVRTEATTDAEKITVERTTSDPAWARQTQALADCQARVRLLQNRQSS